MPRTDRIVTPGQPRHVVWRGNNRQEVFLVDDDRRAYLEFLRKQFDRIGFNVHGCCRMTHDVRRVGEGSSRPHRAMASHPNSADPASRWRIRVGGRR